MFSNTIEGLLRGVSASAVAEIFIILILAALGYALHQAYKGNHTQFTYQAPNILTSLGILGTFTGIVIGLLDFNFGNAQEINESIPNLLGGLKTAFITSLAGMAAAIIFKFVDSRFFFQRRENAESPDEITPNHIHSELRSSNELLEELCDVIGGEEDSSLAGSIQRFRTELRDSRDDERKQRKAFEEELFKEMREFADLLSKSATETVIEALKEVIVDFNNNLTEQFGENFKRLDESVKKLVDWQQQYMEQMEKMAEHYGEGVKAIDSTRVAVTDISEKSAEIPKSMGEMKQVLEVNQHQIQELQRHLEAFVTLKQRATEAMPEIQTQLDSVTKNLAESSDKMKVALLEGATEFGESVRSTNESMKTVANDVQANSDQIKESLLDSADSISSATRDMMASLEKGATTLRESVDDSIDKALEGIKASIEKSVGNMENELNRVIQESGNGLQETNKTMVSHLENSARDLQTSLEQAVSEVLSTVRDSVQQSVGAIPKQVQDAVDTTGQGINKQIEVLDQQMSEEVTRVVGNMGRALTQVTEQFSSDYERLIQQMDAVLRNQPGQRS
jgi:DNA anti-recombination protein RmuC